MLLGYGDGGELGAGRGTARAALRHRQHEFLTMEGRQFSTSRGVVDLCRRLPQPLRPRPAPLLPHAAGPETQDTDFTWAEFVRRNNDELVANWGNLVNRTLTSAHTNFGAVPSPVS